MKPILLLFLMFMSLDINAAYNSSALNPVMSKVVESKIIQRGFATNDPRYYGTLKGINNQVGSLAVSSKSYSLGGVTGRSWLSVGLRGALFSRGAFIALAASGAALWLFDGEDTVQIKINETTGEHGIVGYYWTVGADNYSTATEAAQSLCQRSPNFCNSFTVEQYNSDPTRNDLRTIKFYVDTNKTQLWTTRTASLVKCGTNTVIASCKPDYQPSGQEIIKTVPVQDALNTLTENELASDLSPQIIADAVNKLWENAASAPGYEGFSYDANRPVTSKDVSTAGASRPSLGDFVQPSATPDFSLPSDSSGTKPTNPSTGEQVNLGDDPGIGPPELEKPPTAREILTPLLNINPFTDGEIRNIGAGKCPVPEFSLFESHYKLDSHCILLERNTVLIGIICSVIYILAGLRIVLTA